LGSDGKNYAKCKHCGQRLQKNVTRFKQHLVMLCTAAPDDIKQKFAEKAYSQSCISAAVKRKMQTDFKSPSPKHVMDVTSQAPSIPTLPDVANDGKVEGSAIPCSSTSDNTLQTRCKLPSELPSATTTTLSSDPEAVVNPATKPSVFSFVDRVSVKQQNDLDALWAKAVFTNEWSFNSVSNPYLQQFFAKIRPGWKPPTRYMLSTGLLDRTELEVKHYISEAIERAPNLSLQLDGWSDVNRSSLINVALYAGQPIFLKSVEPGAQRHDADFIAKTIVDCIQTQPEPEKVRSVVTDQPSVMKAAWSKVSKQLPWVNCYGCGAHVVNLLAGDFRKIESVSNVIQNNRMISNFFKSHSMAKEVLAEVTREKYGKPISTILGCPTRWSTEYFMLRRNLRIKGALISTTVDHRIAKELRVSGAEVKQTVLDETFWNSTMRVACLLKPLTAAIQHCEGDDVPVSVMPRIWCHISTQLNRERLTALGYENSENKLILESVESRKDMNIYPITLASHALDPRFHGNSGAHLSEAEWQVACEFILGIADNEHLVRLDVLNDIAEYRSKSGQLFGDSVIWEAVNTCSCSTNPARWWTSFASTRTLSKIASILLSMPATAAMVERCNKAYSGQKTKCRNRLLPARAASLAMVSFNLRIARNINEPTLRSVNRLQRSHILTLSVSPPDTAANASPSSSETNLNPIASTSPTAAAVGSNLPSMLSDSDCEEDDAAIANELDEHDEECDDTDSTEVDDEHNGTDEDETEDSAGEILAGDWVAVRIQPTTTTKQGHIAKESVKISERSRAVMYVARVDHAEDDASLFHVSFLKKYSDTSYIWPDIDDKSSVDKSDVVLLEKPIEDIRASKAGTDVRIKLIFSRNSLEVARKYLNILVGHMR
jgi:hypothetical protein